MQISLMRSLLALTLFAGLGMAQTATIAGVVKSPDGKPLVGAKVTATNLRKTESLDTTSGTDGNFSFPPLAASSWRIAASSPEYSDFSAIVEVGVGQSRSVELVLTSLAESTVVAIANKATTIDTSSARLGVNVTGSEVSGMPLNGRGWGSMSLFAPGAATATDGNFANLRFNGASHSDNRYSFDGIDATSVFDPNPGYLPGVGPQFRLQASLDAVREFRIDTGLEPAETGMAAGAVVNVVTKSGTDQQHFTVFEYLRNDKLAARDFYDGADKLRLRLNQFGGNWGGTLHGGFIPKERLYLFVNVEGLRQTAGSNVIENVPSAAARLRAVPAVQPLLGIYPIGTRHTANPDIDIAQKGNIASLEETNFTGRLDYNLTPQHHLFLRYMRTNGTWQSPDASVTERDLSADVHPENWAAALTSSFAGGSFNEFRAGFNKSPISYTLSTPFAPLAQAALSVGGLTTLAAGGIGALTSSTSGRNATIRGRAIHLSEQYGIRRGNHNLKMGGEVRKLTVPYNFLGGTAYTYSNLNNFLANTGVSISYVGDQPVHWAEETLFGLFIEDEWHVRPGLTVNIGLRYDYFTALKERNNQVQLFDSATLRFLDPKTPFYQTDPKLFAPRLGIAWSPLSTNGKTVVRLGGAILHSSGELRDMTLPIENDTTRLTVTGLKYPVTPADLQTGATAPLSPRGFDVGGYKFPNRIMEFGISVQQQLPFKMVGQAGYIGNLGRNLFTRTIANLITGVDSVKGTITRQNNAFSEIDTKTGGGTNDYHALQLSVSRRFVDELTIGSQYTFGKSIGVSQGTAEASTIQNPFCLVCDRAVNTSDVRHYLNVNMAWDIPVGTGRRYLNKGAIGRLAGPWNVGGIFNTRSGLPINVLLTRPDTLIVDAAGHVVSSAGSGAYYVVNTPGGGSTRKQRRPDLVPGVDPYLRTSSGLWLNPAAFAIPAVGKYGNLGRDALVGPGASQFDMQVTRRFPIGEAHALEFRTDLYNIFNHPNFANPSATLPNALPSMQPGQAFSAATAPGFGVLSSTIGRNVGLGTGRQIQLGMRLSF